MEFNISDTRRRDDLPPLRQHIFEIDSRNRDVNIYPHPNYYVYQLPFNAKSVYKLHIISANITKHVDEPAPIVYLRTKPEIDIFTTIDPPISQAIAVPNQFTGSGTVMAIRERRGTVIGACMARFSMDGINPGDRTTTMYTAPYDKVQDLDTPISELQRLTFEFVVTKNGNISRPLMNDHVLTVEMYSTN